MTQAWALAAGSAIMLFSTGQTLRSAHEFPHPQMGKARRPQPQRHVVRRQLLRWIDEEAAIYAIVQLGNQRVVTKYISEINFVSASRQGDIIELGITATEFGRTSITLKCQVRNKITRKSILTVEKIVFVNLDEDGQPAPHGRTEIRYIKDQFDIED
ncbi:4-hydroxybenzoyl-CoA thioesterase domain-containing protein [Pseudomonas syringae pv. actinidiae]|nr:4-hydroxybenzoyl-CoA thioesterase domain-containing protein [Pseudomonas syringae pv. actinidiae]